MNASELAAARARLGLTHDEIAAEIGLTPHSYVACEEGRATLPATLADRLAYRLAVLDREEALASSGLESCAWIAEWERAFPEQTATMSAHVARAHAHAATCERCLARQRFIRERFPEMPKPPVSAAARAFNRLATWVLARPAWLRPAIWGALAFGALTSLRVLAALPRVMHDPGSLGAALGAVLLATLGGAAAGLAYGFVGQPLMRALGRGRRRP